MPEGMNVEAAHKLQEHGGSTSEPTTHHGLEIVEALVLAIVAIATAWSGYQAALWEGEEAELYSKESKFRVAATEDSTLGAQLRLLDVTTFNTWIAADQAGNDKLAKLYVRRFSPEYRVAFDAWLKTDPLNNPDAPPGPAYMPEYENPLIERSEIDSEKADATFEAATHARHIADDYIKVTVLLATVLFLVVMAQRFKFIGAKIGTLILGGVLISVAMYWLLTFPRL